MSFSRFHQVVQRWCTTTLGDPTPAQARGWTSILDGRHTLIAPVNPPFTSALRPRTLHTLLPAV